MRLTNEVNKEIIRKLLHAEDYRIEIVSLIDAEFLTFAVDFFKTVHSSKIQSKDSKNLDWYKSTMLNEDLSKEEIAINSGLNMKTISNMFNSGTKETVISASIPHFKSLIDLIDAYLKNSQGLYAEFQITINDTKVSFNFEELLVVLNTIAVKRAALRGGAWSTAGKRVEKPLMFALCRLFGVDKNNYSIRSSGREISNLDFEREIDFYLISSNKKRTEHKCEVKLMGIGNPESADAVIARDSSVFIADKLSVTNKRQLDSRKVHWVELRSKDGFMKFENVLKNLGIPTNPLISEWEVVLESILDDVFK
jgi:hypothetical protein